MGELGIARKRQLSVMEMGDECGVNWEMGTIVGSWTDILDGSYLPSYFSIIYPSHIVLKLSIFFYTYFVCVCVRFFFFIIRMIKKINKLYYLYSRKKY